MMETDKRAARVHHHTESKGKDRQQMQGQQGETAEKQSELGWKMQFEIRGKRQS